MVGSTVSAMVVQTAPAPRRRPAATSPTARQPHEPATGPGSAAAVQTCFDDLGTPLSEVTFVVVDLETTGGSPTACAITEIGAVKVRGGQVLGEFATLVDPGQPIPAFIATLTGITDASVAGAPRIAAVLPTFLDFCRGAVLVAHNARFDVGFLRANARRLGLRWPGPAVLDTVTLARHVLGDEVRNHRLATLAPHFGSPTVPIHRALDDARATVDVLHGLLERIGNLGVTSWEDLEVFSNRVPPARRQKRHLADGLPQSPGVYLFHGPGDEVLYVGTSVNLYRRVRSYFTAAESRARIGEMLQVATRVTPIVCQTRLEAQVRELRAIADHRPRYNRRSRDPNRAPWLKLTDEPFPRLSMVRTVRRNGRTTYLGPFSSASAAEQAMAALHEVFALRQCTTRLPVTPTPGRVTACVLADLGRCGAPCIGAQPRDQYLKVVTDVTAVITGAVTPLTTHLMATIHRFASSQRYEDAARQRDRLEAFLTAAERTQRREPLTVNAELMAARRRNVGGWEIVLVRHGRLAGTAVTERGEDPRPTIAALQAGGEVVVAPTGGSLPALPEETDLILRWLAEPGVRLVSTQTEWTCPVGGAGQARHALSALTTSPVAETAAPP